MEHKAGAGGILISPETACVAAGPVSWRRSGTGPAAAPRAAEPHEPKSRCAAAEMPAETLARCLSPAIRAHVLAGGGTSEHRPVTVAFIRFEGTDALIERDGPGAAAEALHRLVSVVEAATEQQGVAFLASDVDADGGKLILTAGAPKVTGDDEERMLLALRTIVSADLPVPIRIGVHRGSVFAGDIGPFYRRTYTVMGDAVNLAARLMAKAGPGQIYATADVLDHSNTLFSTRPSSSRLWSRARRNRFGHGRWVGSRARARGTLRCSDCRLIGRERELAMMREALASARAGAGRLIEIVGEAGIGKTRLLETLRDDAAGLRQLHAVCEAYSAHPRRTASGASCCGSSWGSGGTIPMTVVAKRFATWYRNGCPTCCPGCR